MEIIKIAKAVYGCIYIISAVWIILDIFFSVFYHKVFPHILPLDLGYSIVLLSIGIISMAYIGSNDIIKLASSLMISTIFGSVMFFLRLLIILSHLIDAYILSLEGELFAFNFVNEIGYLEIYVAPITFLLLAYSYYILRKKTI